MQIKNRLNWHLPAPCKFALLSCTARSWSVFFSLLKFTFSCGQARNAPVIPMTYSVKWFARIFYNLIQNLLNLSGSWTGPWNYSVFVPDTIELGHPIATELFYEQRAMQQLLRWILTGQIYCSKLLYSLSMLLLTCVWTVILRKYYFIHLFIK